MEDSASDLLGSEELREIFENEWLGVQTHLMFLNGKIQIISFSLEIWLRGLKKVHETCGFLQDFCQPVTVSLKLNLGLKLLC